MIKDVVIARIQLDWQQGLLYIDQALSQAYAAGYDVGRCGMKGLKTQPVFLIDRNGKQIFFNSIKEAASFAGVEREAVSRAIRYKRTTRKGYKFEKA